MYDVQPYVSYSVNTTLLCKTSLTLPLEVKTRFELFPVVFINAIVMCPLCHYHTVSASSKPLNSQKAQLQSILSGLMSTKPLNKSDCSADESRPISLCDVTPNVTKDRKFSLWTKIRPVLPSVRSFLIDSFVLKLR